MTLYRGEAQERHESGKYGLSWSPNQSVAEPFAYGRCYQEGIDGVLLKIQATPNLIVLSVNEYADTGVKPDENEYILDPRLVLGSASVVSLWEIPDCIERKVSGT
ncbi:MAG: hypothetical protein O3A53_17175 [Acidobacteria bacterium]|nr:hypothetical protein [Acidobacteriota bacterium]MDA1236519.1 hypothetical protein [Acidobacteriota bacterium]